MRSRYTEPLLAAFVHRRRNSQLFAKPVLSRQRSLTFALKSGLRRRTALQQIETFAQLPGGIEPRLRGLRMHGRRVPGIDQRQAVSGALVRLASEGLLLFV